MTRPPVAPLAEQPSPLPKDADRPRILVIDTEEQLIRILRFILIEAGYEVAAARTAAEAMICIGGDDVDLVLLDHRVSDLDGACLLKHIRRSSHVPIIVTADEAVAAERIAALDAGANDFLTRPFDVGELLARIRVALRRRPTTVTYDRFAIDLKTRRVTIDGKSIRLSRNELTVVSLLLEAKGEPVTCEEIRRALWPTEKQDYLSKVRVLIWQVRRKIEPQPQAPQFLLTEPPSSYRLYVE